MGILDRVAARWPGLVAAKAQPSMSWQRSEARAEQWTMPDGTAYTRQAELYKKLSWVQIAVSAVAQTVATTPFSVKQLVVEDEKDIPNHAFELLLRKPNPLQSRFEFLYATDAWFQITGNYYWWLNRASEHDPPSELWLIPSNKIKPIPDGNLFLRGYLYDPGNGIGKITLEPWEVMHGYSFNPSSMFVGLSPIEAIAVSATGDLKMQEWNTNFFARDNAKTAGFLAFKDPIGDADWDRLKAETKREHGGTKRSLMMIRGAGAGGVEWVATSMSQADMEFLDGRTFNKEEIWALYAPGLSSMLAVNATEANSVAGRATFLELAVWPKLTSLAEKITNDLLPSYGDGIVGEFDDIRHTDRTLELAEDAAYALTHTIDEIRKKNGDKPLGDGRGQLLPAEVTKGLTDTRTPDEQAQAAADKQAAALELAQASQPPQPDVPQPAVSPGEAAVAEANKAADLDRWERKALKALKQGKSPAVTFESEYLNEEDTNVIVCALRDAQTPEAVKTAFSSAVVTAGRRGYQSLHDASHEGAPDAHGWTAAAHKTAALAAAADETATKDVFTRGRQGAGTQRAETALPFLRSESGGVYLRGDATQSRLDGAAKMATLTPTEQALMDRIRAILTQHGKTAAAAVVDGNMPPLDALSSDLRAAIQSAVVQAVVERAHVLASDIGVDFDPGVMSSAAADWAATASFNRVSGITETTQALLQKAISAYHSTPGMTQADVIARLTGAFGERRASVIAVTSMTEAAAQGTITYQSYLKENGLEFERIWNAVNDGERMCQLCGPMDGKPEDEWGDLEIPAHPDCRCNSSLRLKQ